MRRGLFVERRRRDHVGSGIRLCRPRRCTGARAPNMGCLGAVCVHSGRDARHAVFLAQCAYGAVGWDTLTPSPPGALCRMSVSWRQWSSSGGDRCSWTDRQNSHAVGGRMARHLFHHHKAAGGTEKEEEEFSAAAEDTKQLT
jgi:hypothetical protein